MWCAWEEKLKLEQVSVNTMETEAGNRDSTPLVNPDKLKNERAIVRMFSSHKLSDQKSDSSNTHFFLCNT